MVHADCVANYLAKDLRGVWSSAGMPATALLTAWLVCLSVALLNCRWSFVFSCSSKTSSPPCQKTRKAYFQKRQHILCEFIIYCKLATGEYVHLLGRTSQDKNLPERFPLSPLEQFPQQSFPILRRDRNSLLLCCCCWPWRPRPEDVQDAFTMIRISWGIYSQWQRKVKEYIHNY